MTKLLLCLATLFAATTARADLLIEPYVGYGVTGHFGQSTTYNLTGAEYGARLGYQSLGFMIGADYLSGSLTSPTSPNSTTVTPNDIGVFIGYKFPVFLRVYGEYFFLSDPKLAAGGGTAKPDGSALRLGAQFTGLPFVAIGLEYYKATWTKEKNSGLSYTPDLTGDMVSLVVSLPLTF